MEDNKTVKNIPAHGHHNNEVSTFKNKSDGSYSNSDINSANHREKSENSLKFKKII